MPNDVQDFLDQLRVEVNTREAYARALRLFARWAEKEAPETEDEAQAFLDYRADIGRSPSTIAIDATALEQYFRWKKIVVDLKRPAVTLVPVKYCSREEIKALIAAAEAVPWLPCLIALLYDSGARIREILLIRVDGINWEGYLQVRRKGGRIDLANVSPWGMGYLREWLDLRVGRDPRVFGGRSYRRAYDELKKAARKASITNFHPHMLRHSRAIHLSEDTSIRWEDIGYQLGHVNPLVTVKIYTRPMPQDLKKRIPAPVL